MSTRALRAGERMAGGAPAAAVPQPASAEAARGLLPWAVVGAFVAACCMTVGWYWDISWHRSIGRDTALTLPHLAIYSSLIVSFASAVALVLSFTFGSRRDAPAVTVLGFRAPAGAFLTLWGLSFQGTAIVFDLWWHDAYGLDLGIFSPPHYAIMIGASALFTGLFLIVVRHCNALRALGRAREARWIAIGFAALGLVSQVLGLDPVYGPAAYASLATLVSVAVGVPFMIALIDAYAGDRWASSLASVFYALHVVVLMQIFQLFPATPRFGPVYVDPDRFLPPPFPMPLGAAAVALALCFPVVSRRLHGVPRTAAFGAVFALAMGLAGRLQEALLASPLGDNRFFAGHSPPSAFQPGYVSVVTLQADARGLAVLLVAAALAACTAWVGQRAGGWLRGVSR